MIVSVRNESRFSWWLFFIKTRFHTGFRAIHFRRVVFAPSRTGGFGRRGESSRTTVKPLERSSNVKRINYKTIQIKELRDKDFWSENGNVRSV